MRFGQPLARGSLVRRYKRFLADVRREDGSVLTVHCPNSGSMRGLLVDGAPVLFSRSDKLTRKYPHTLEMIQVGTVWVGINTSRTNSLVREAMGAGLIDELAPVHAIKAEVKVSEKSRLDFLVEHGDGSRTFVEVKNCTLAEGGVAMFPDAVTSRGTRHLEELAALLAPGTRGMVVFCVQRADARVFSPADRIDPLYGATLRKVAALGVLPVACQAEVTPEGITVVRRLPVKL